MSWGACRFEWAHGNGPPPGSACADAPDQPDRCNAGSPELKALCAAVEAANVDEVRTLLQKGGIDLNADQQTFGRRFRPFSEAMAKVVVPERVTELSIDAAAPTR